MQTVLGIFFNPCWSTGARPSMSVAKRLVQYYEQAIIWERERENTHSANSLHLFCCKTHWILMISIYQEPWISFKAFTSNLFSIFFPLWEKKNKKIKKEKKEKKNNHSPAGFKSERRQECKVSFFWKTAVQARLERDRSDTKRKKKIRSKYICR